jgi:nicotinate-nucleotide adenylyltransferase
MLKADLHTSTHHIGLFGGTFDPIHYGHLVIAEEVRARLNLTEMIFIPAGQPPHKSSQIRTPAHHRLAMVQLAIASNPHFSISRVEVDRQGPSYLVDTLRILRQHLGEQTALSFVIGWDSLADFHTWYDPDGILKQLTYLVAVQRPGYVDNDRYNKQLEARLPGLARRLRVISAPQLEISSTDLRGRVAQGQPIKYQTPDAVERYINEHNLYQAETV